MIAVMNKKLNEILREMKVLNERAISEKRAFDDTEQAQWNTLDVER